MGRSRQVHSTFRLDVPLIQEDSSIYENFLQSTLADEDRAPCDLLASIPHPSANSYGPLATLSALLSALPGPWPILQLHLAYNEAWKLLPEEAKSGNASPHGFQLIDRALRQCKQSYSSLLDLYHSSSSETAIIDPDNGEMIRHNELHAAIRSFELPIHFSCRRNPVVAISLPNGTLLALTVLAVSNYYVAAPIAHGNGVGAEQFRAEVLQSRSNVVLACESDVSRLGLHDSWLQEAGIQVMLVELAGDSTLLVRELDRNIIPSTSTTQPISNHSDDVGILLFTSGTSGTKKLVPVTIHSIVCGTAMVIQSWGLSTSMRCLNQMPLNHVGGLVRNLYGPIFSGGSVICCGAFDANLFWECVEDYSPTWYYASPSMHQCILDAAEDRPDSLAKSKISMICNAAGGLLPSLAHRLRDVFSNGDAECTILPSYGMTECMPISTPPKDYRLDKPGTSGISVGPEISVMGRHSAAVAIGSVGRICVRGAPMFSGYLKDDNTIDISCFNGQGWFDTGDLGYLDEDGFIHITGRSKEVINRGGELISPFEVEEAIVAASNVPNSPTFRRIDKALAFPVSHDVLQEVVGICIVTPAGQLRTDLRSVQLSVKNSLAQVKTPVLLVYMDGGLPVNNNKVLRIKLAERLVLPEISDSTSIRERHYEAVCPPPNTKLNEPISCWGLPLDRGYLRDACMALTPSSIDIHIIEADFHPILYLAPKPDHSSSSISQESVDSLLAELLSKVHAYDVLSKAHISDIPFIRTVSGTVDEKHLQTHQKQPRSNYVSARMASTENTIAMIFAEILSLNLRDVSPQSDFFELGGNSMSAGRLLARLRKEFEVRLSIDVLFSHPRLCALADVINERLNTAREDPQKPSTTSAAKDDLFPGCEQTYSSTRPLVLLLHLLPLCIFYPAKRAFMWTLFIYCLSYTQRLITNMTMAGRLTNLVVSMFVARLVTKTLAPVVAVLVKTLVIGRYKEGLYPMWGGYHTRWWICQKAAQVAGMGTWNTFNWSRCFYHRCMGATIGKNVTLAKGATLGEQDLLTIGDNAVLDRCIARPFAVERNTSMYLARIRLGTRSSVGLASIVAAGTNVPDNVCIGPNSSSWEIRDADEANRDLSASKISGPNAILQVLIGLPVQLLCIAIGAIPWLGCLTALVNHEPRPNIVDDLRNITIWFASSERVGLHYAALAANATLGPAFFFLGVLAVKKFFDACCCEPVEGYARSFSQMTKFRMHLMRTLMPSAQLHKLAELFGTHYEMTSVLMRLMGAKVGQRVYWPGTGPSVQDYQLLRIDDDVVFGSRSHLVTSDSTGSNGIRIGNGAMIADRVVILPGVEVGEKAVMGSGALTRRNSHYAADTTWVGSKAGNCIWLNARTAKSEESQIQDFSNNTSCTTLVEKDSSETSGWSKTEGGNATPTVEGHSNLKLPYPCGTRKTRASVRWADQEAPPTPKVDSSSPFGRAFYQCFASYRVWTQFEIFMYSSIITIATAVYWNIGSISAVQIVARLFQDRMAITLAFLGPAWYRPFTLFTLFFAIIVGIMAIQSLIVLLFLISAKWILVGTRKPGCYSWDISSYCQRWQLYLKLESFRRHCYGGNGILGMLTGTHWIVLYFRALGAVIGKDCALFAGGLPSLYFTEPDLLTIGDRVAIDDASLVGHINTRGKFDLNPLHVGDRSVLRTGSRLLSGARMEADACLLEHTLVMAGDVVDAGRTLQGWPADECKDFRMPTMEAKEVWRVRN